MPFDGTGFPPRYEPKPNQTPTPTDDTAITVLIIVAAVVLLLTPFSLNALVDIIQYARGG